MVSGVFNVLTKSMLSPGGGFGLRENGYQTVVPGLLRISAHHGICLKYFSSALSDADWPGGTVGILSGSSDRLEREGVFILSYIFRLD